MRYTIRMWAMQWLIGHWSGFIESTGIVAGLVFTGISLRIDARVRRAETVIEITKQHRELWQHFHERSSLAGLFDRKRDLEKVPLTAEEIHFINSLLNHLRATFYARVANIFVQPECLSEDIREFLSYPAAKAAWEAQKKSHEPKFVAFVDQNAAGR